MANTTFSRYDIDPITGATTTHSVNALGRSMDLTKPMSKSLQQSTIDTVRGLNASLNTTADDTARLDKATKTTRNAAIAADAEQPTGRRAYIAEQNLQTREAFDANFREIEAV